MLLFFVSLFFYLSPALTSRPEIICSPPFADPKDSLKMTLERMGAMQLCHHHDRRVAKNRKLASGDMFDQPSSMLTGKDVVSHSSSVVLTNILFFLSF